MKNKYAIPILKEDVLLEDFSNIYKAIRLCSEDREKLIEARNKWKVFFMGYDDDPREVSDIPEIVNWIKQSVEAGIPWFYFMSTDGQALGLSTFLICGGADHDPDYPERYFFDRGKILPFIKKNLNNLAAFVDKYNIPFDVGKTATDEVMRFIAQLLNSSENEVKPAREVNKNKMLNEAFLRIEMLENLFELNPKVGKYFKEGRLYYSYLVYGGIVGMIDSISYDERYADAVRRFENQTNSLVYHAIEHEDTLSLLYVSADFKEWEAERPNGAGIKSCVININTMKSEYGYIKIDVNNGALYRRDPAVYSSPLSKKQTNVSDFRSAEIVERLEILKNTGIETDLDITQVYIEEGEICCSLLKSIMGLNIGIINRISSIPVYEHLSETISEVTEKKIYFLMGTMDSKVAFLYLSDDTSEWENEKLALEKMNPYAIVFDNEKMTAQIQQIRFEIINGGPIALCDL